MPDPDSPVPAPQDAAASRPASARPQLAKPQPKPKSGEDEAPEAEAGAGSGSATGFVGMLSRQQFDADMLSATRADEAIQRARRESAPAAAAPAEAAEGSGWFRLAMPVAALLALVLLGIGAWAIGALVYMHNVSPIQAQDVHYPLIAWRLDIGNTGNYTPASKFMARAMLLCVPVAGLLVVMAWMVRPRRK